MNGTNASDQEAMTADNSGEVQGYMLLTRKAQPAAEPKGTGPFNPIDPWPPLDGWPPFTPVMQPYIR